MILEPLFESDLLKVVFACLTFASIYLWGRTLYEKKREGEIPFAPSVNLPIFGHLLALSLSPTKQIKKWHKKVGPILKLNMGNQIWVMISDPYLAHDIFVGSGTATSSRPYHHFLSDLYSKGGRGLVFSNYGTIWKNNRKAVFNALKPSSIDKFNEVLEFEAEETMERFTKIAEKGKAFNPCLDLQLSSLNVIMTVLCGKRFKSIEDPLYQNLVEAIDLGLYYGGIVGNLDALLPNLSWIGKIANLEEKKKSSSKKILDMMNWHIQEALNNEKPSLVKDLFQIKNEDGVLSYDDINVLAIDICGAGTDTTASTLFWTFAILSQYPEVQTRIVKELDEWRAKYPNRKSPSFHMDREHFPYAICVQKEVMRFHPTVPLGVPHTCEEDIVVNGYLIPKGATLFSSTESMHRNPIIYEDPDVFRPERFLNNTQKMSVAANFGVNKRDHFGFGWGRRLCPGIYLAELQIFNFYVHFFSKFVIEADTNRVKKLEQVDRGLVCQPVMNSFRLSKRTQ
ncbi:cytochrome P450 [Sporodiniella umbellata]|nr:cytochrome P450 [Sporodiniella umbellata]